MVTGKVAVSAGICSAAKTRTAVITCNARPAMNWKCWGNSCDFPRAGQSVLWARHPIKAGLWSAQPEELAGVGARRHAVLIVGHDGCYVERAPGNWRSETGGGLDDETGGINRPGKHHVGAGLPRIERKGEELEGE